jgi:hypothetical protein
MTRTNFVAAALALVAALSAAPAQAQALRTFVSTTGSDTNPCSITQPCRHFQAAVNVTAAGGEVDALDPGGYSPVTINQAITIEGQGWSYVAPPTTGAAITINAGSGNVYLHGISLNGVGTTGTNGIQSSSSGSLEVLNCVIKDFYNGVLVEPQNGITQVLIKDTTVLNSSNAGIYLTPHGTANLLATIDRTTADLNGYGMYFDSSPSSGYMSVMVNESHADNNVNDGMVINNGPSSQQTDATISNSTISINAIQVSGESNLAVLFTHSVLSDGGFIITGTPSVLTDGTNTGYANSPQPRQTISPW